MMPSLLNGCAAPAGDALDPWDGPSAAEHDIRLQVLSYGLLAANPHNIQPWLVRLDGPRQCSLFVDPERLLPATDPVYRQIHIGQGAFLENVRLAACALEHHAQITLFPEGEYGSDALEDKPVARIDLQPQEGPRVHPLFEVIMERQTNKRAFNSRSVHPTDIQTLLDLTMDYSQADGITSDVSWHWFDAEEDRAELTDIIGSAMAVEVDSHERHLETWRLFRFNQREIERYRDGFSYGNNGITGFRRWLVERLYSRESARPVDSSWAQFPVDQHYEIAASAPLFGALTTTGNSRRNQVDTGRLYQRLNLAATHMGISLHPHSQVLQEYPDMAPLQQRFRQRLGFRQGDTIQMLYRLGYAEPVERTPRRRLEALIHSTNKNT